MDQRNDEVALYPIEDFYNKKFLANGGQGSVFKMHHRELKEVAVKKYSESANLIDIRNEIEILIQLRKHPFIINFIGCVVDDYKTVIGYAMESMWGDLDSVLHGREPGTSTLLDIDDLARQAIAGLRYIHSKGILHRDVKPKNMLLSPQQIILKMTDFGESRIFDSKDGELEMTLGKGTLPYSAPELCVLAEYGHYTEKCDVYSMGITLWEMAMRKKPFSEFSNSKQLWHHIAEGGQPPIEELPAGRMKEIIRRCLSIDPEQRYSSKALHKAIRGKVPVPEMWIKQVCSGLNDTPEARYAKLMELRKNAQKCFDSAVTTKQTTVKHLAVLKWIQKEFTEPSVISACWNILLDKWTADMHAFLLGEPILTYVRMAEILFRESIDIINEITHRISIINDENKHRLHSDAQREIPSRTYIINISVEPPRHQMSMNQGALKQLLLRQSMYDAAIGSIQKYVNKDVIFEILPHVSINSDTISDTMLDMYINCKAIDGTLLRISRQRLPRNVSRPFWFSDRGFNTAGVSSRQDTPEWHRRQRERLTMIEALMDGVHTENSMISRLLLVTLCLLTLFAVSDAWPWHHHGWGHRWGGGWGWRRPWGYGGWGGPWGGPFYGGYPYGGYGGFGMGFGFGGYPFFG